MRFFLIFAIVIAAMTFAVQNAPTVTINLFIWRFDASLALVVASCFAAGVLATLLAALPQLYQLHRMRSHERSLIAQLADLEAQEMKRTGAGHDFDGRSHAPAAH